MTQPSRKQISVAPMMAYTDRHCRHLHRLASPSAKLFTEMVTTGAVLNGPRERLLAFHPAEHPVAVQLGGNDPRALADCARIAANAGFDEINLNVGCPSSRVQEGRIGACLMAEPDLVADGYSAMVAACSVEVTVKCRLGIDDQTSDDFLDTFVGTLAAAGCRTFYVHARIALLNGLSPAQNRSVPPLQYHRVFALKERWPALNIVLNGGLDAVEQIQEVCRQCDGAMIGRAAYSNPLLLNALHVADHGTGALSAFELYDAYCAYVRDELDHGTPLANMTRHMLGLFSGMPGARQFRRSLSDAGRLKQEGAALLDSARQSVARHAA